MKKLLLFTLSLLCTVGAVARTLNVVAGDVTYAVPAEQAGTMTYADGESLTILGKTLSIADITRVYIDDSTVTDNTVTVTYSDGSATVVVAGNVMQYITAAVSGAHVSITQSDEVSADNVGEITYSLSGSSSDGEFYLAGSYKSTVELNGVTLTNATAVYSGAAVHIQNGKRIDISVKKGTTNTLSDCASGSQKGALYVKGHAEFKGKGVLNVYGNLKHGIKAGEYIEIKNCTINVLSAVGDGVNCNQYFLMESGELNISGSGDDGIQCDLDGTTSTGVIADHEDEDSGNIYIEGGTITVTSTATAAKGIKAAGDMNIVDGTITVTTSGDGDWDDDDGDTKAASGLSCDGNLNISGGTVTLNSTGSGGKGAKCDGTMTITGGTIDVTTTGGLYYNNGSGTVNTNYTGDTDNVNSNYYSSPKGLKAGVKTEVSTNNYTYSGGMTISGGTITVSTSGNNGEGIESKNQLDISGGTITVNSYDDCINSAQDMTISGTAVVTAVAGNNDAIDSNADLYVNGGTIIACGASGAEGGLDAAEGYHLYITGGTVLAIGGSNNGVTATTGSQPVLTTTGSVSAGTVISVKSGSSTIASFTVPSTYSASSQGGGGPQFAPGGPGGDNGGGGGPGGDGGSSGPGGDQGGNNTAILISCLGLTSGTSYTIYGDSTQIGTATAATSSSSGSGPGF